MALATEHDLSKYYITYQNMIQHDLSRNVWTWYVPKWYDLFGHYFLNMILSCAISPWLVFFGLYQYRMNYNTHFCLANKFQTNLISLCCTWRIGLFTKIAITVFNKTLMHRLNSNRTLTIVPETCWWLHVH